MTDWARMLDEAIEADAEVLLATRRHLHAHPEPSGEEYRTVEWLAARLAEAGVPYRLVPSRRGIIAGHYGRSEGSLVAAFRADLDALHIDDLKAVPYKSTVPGVMHACGHDAHATMALGAARALWRCYDQLPWPTRWRAIFQPAEETGEGAAEMVASGAVEGVRAIVALHVDPDRAVGSVAQRVGTITACCSDMEVTVTGVGGHAARPHKAIDPIAAAAEFVSLVYRLIPRSVDASKTVVVTFGAFHGGASPNVIPDRVELRGTVRTRSRATASAVQERIRRIGQGLSTSTGAEFDIRFDRGVDAVFNDPEVTCLCAAAAAQVVGAAQVDDFPFSMGGEDFGGYLKETPGCLLRLGVAAPDRPRHPLHSPHFDIDERALTVGAKILARCAVMLAESR